MLTLTIRTDKPEAEIGLFADDKQLAYTTWQAHRELSNTILKKIDKLFSVKGQTFSDLGGIVCFKGPGSFTGLRIGLTVGNVLAYSLHTPIVGAMGDDWQANGVQKLLAGVNEKILIPEYGAEANITEPRK